MLELLLSRECLHVRTAALDELLDERSHVDELCVRLLRSEVPHGRKPRISA